MIENINLKDFPKKSGVYWFICNDEVVYVGSSKDLYKRMVNHKVCIKTGGDHKGTTQKELYTFLQQNEFQIKFELTQNYRQKEQDLIEKTTPMFNTQRAYTGIGKCKNKTEYRKKHRHKYHEEHLKVIKNYRELHKDDIKEYTKHYYEKYYKRLCRYNGEVLTLNALKQRFIKQGLPHPNIEAKKYLIQ